MIFLLVLYVLATSLGIYSNTVTSPQIRILDVATKASETRLIPHRVGYQNTFHPYFQHQNNYEQTRPLKSYVIYDEYPLKIFKEWKANTPSEFPALAPQSYLELRRQQNVEFPPNHFQNGQQIQRLPPPNPTLAYRSVYSNIIKVFDNSLEDFDQNRFQSERYVKPFEGGVWRAQNPIEYEPLYPQDIPRRLLYHNLKLPENFPKVFLPNEKFHFPSFDDRIPQPFQPEGMKSTLRYDTHTVNYDKETPRHPDEVEVLSEMALNQKNQKKTLLCGFIRVNQRQFPVKRGGPCARSDDDLPLVPLEYPDYSTLSNDKIPVEHRREYFQMKRIKRGGLNESNRKRQKRDAGFGYGYSGWGSPFGYDNGYDGYFGSNYPGRAGYRNNYNSGYYSGRNTNQGYRNNYSGSRYDDYDDDYQNNDDSNSRGLSSYLTNGGRRYKNRKNNDDEEEDEDDNNSNNREEDSEEEMERMNSNRRDTNDRRNNDDSRDRRRNNNNNNNNNNDDDDYRDSRRNNNRNNNSRRYNNNNSNNNRRYNDRYDNNSNNRNRYYGHSNGYNGNNSGYGSNYGNYGSNYGGGYGNGGYGSSYGSNGGYGYGGYGNGFGSF